jgi:hypothetical protein
LTPEKEISDEERRAFREKLMHSSKSGRIISGEDLSKQIEEAKKSDFVNPIAPVHPDADQLIPSTKNPSRAVTRDDIKKLLESRQEKSEEEVIPPP